MDLILETQDLRAYLKESRTVDFHSPLVQEKTAEIQFRATRDEEQAKIAFKFVRDEIHHSFDLNSDIVTISASEAMACKEGICFAKSHLLAALLRGLGIPAGFCYQRVTRKGTPESGYALHGLNAVYLPSRKVWFRIDPRGNKEGVNSQFNIEHEQLAYTIKTGIGEMDYPYVFANPLEEVITSMHDSADSHELFTKRPEALNISQDTLSNFVSAMKSIR